VKTLPKKSPKQDSARDLADLRGKIAAIDKSQAVIEFRMDGTILTANENFLKAMGYALDEIVERHHGMFVDDRYRESSDYKEFWTRLGNGEFQTGEYKRVGKGGREVWIQERPTVQGRQVRD
jgi:methyl-accepting chemotaxis protein